MGRRKIIDSVEVLKKEDECLDYQSLMTYNKELADIAFYGLSESRNVKTSGYTELGTTGSFEKTWQYEDNAWHLYKVDITEHLPSRERIVNTIQIAAERTKETFLELTAFRYSVLEEYILGAYDFLRYNL